MDFLEKVKQKFKNTDFLIIEKAFFLCKKTHKGQFRRSGKEYYTHPVEVATILLEWQSNAQVLIAGLLHDSIEDSTLTLETIEQEFGALVAAYVYGLTDDFIEKDILDKYLLILEETPEILMIKLADRLHNMRTIDAMPKIKKVKKAYETLTISVPLSRYLGLYEVADELKKLCKKALQQ
jgi:(p)ppGpp synthase/HD superfamily hydrolase